MVINYCYSNLIIVSFERGFKFREILYLLPGLPISFFWIFRNSCQKFLHGIFTKLKLPQSGTLRRYFFQNLEKTTKNQEKKGKISCIIKSILVNKLEHQKKLLHET